MKLNKDSERLMKKFMKRPKSKYKTLNKFRHKKVKRYEPEEKPKKKERKTYKQNWKAYNLAQTKEFIMFQEILYDLIDSLIKIRPLLFKNGRPFSDIRDILFCCVMKVYLGKSTRRNTGFLTLAKERGYINKIPHYNTIIRYYDNELITPTLKHLIEQSGLPLKQIETDFAVDSSGFSTSLFERWFDVRLQKKRKKRLWKKAHIFSGVKTNIITAIDISIGYHHDNPYFENLARNTAKNFNIKEVSGDGAYCSRKSMKLITELGGVPYFMFRKDATCKSDGTMIYAKMYKFFKKHREEYLKHYHKRSNVESIFHMIKKKIGMSLFCFKETAQINEILCKCLVHNLCVLIQEYMEVKISLDFMKCKKCNYIS